MAEFLTMQEAEDKFGKKGRTNAALTLGIIGTALGAFAGNNNGCGCGGGNGILGGLFEETTTVALCSKLNKLRQWLWLKEKWLRI